LNANLNAEESDSDEPKKPRGVKTNSALLSHSKGKEAATRKINLAWNLEW